jgi:hypothetical protein
LDCYEDFGRALNVENDENLREGIELTYNKFKDILTKEGVEEIPAKGEKFDLNKHEALMVQASDDVENGYVIGKYNLESSYYGKMTDAAFALEVGGVSEPIEIVTDLESSYYVLYKAQKSYDHFEENYDSIKYVYLMNCVGKMLHDIEIEMKNNVGYSDFLNGINHADISMD